MVKTHRLFSVTICAKRKPGMGEDEYHQYISETHAPLLKRLLVEKKIVDYTMVCVLELSFGRSKVKQSLSPGCSNTTHQP